MRLAEASLTIGDLDLGGIDAESDYKLDAYFLTTPHVQAALRGRRTLFLGRKGSGKSALFTQLSRLAVENGFPNLEVLPITPDMYAWRALRDYEEQGILSEQAHTNAWKLTIAIEAASLLVSLDRQWVGEAEEAVDRLGRFLRENFGTPNPGLSKAAAAVLAGLQSFKLSALGFEIGFDRGPSGDAQPITPAIVNALLGMIATVTRQQGVLAALDRLDDSWDGREESRSLMIGLLKAAKELNDSFGSDNPEEGLRVLVFLRSDIYDVLRFDDKDKHRPTEEHITWSPEELKEMLALRLPAGVGVDELFEQGDMRGSISPFNYIVKRTFLRPREVLQFMDEAIRQTGPSAVEITKDDIRNAEDRYSRWKVDDLKQEFAKVFPEYSTLLECLRQEVHRYESLGYLQALLETKRPDLVERFGGRALLDVLFESSVIGIRLGDAGSARFKCEDADLALPAVGAVYVHQSLNRGLNIRETRRSSADVETPETGTLQDRITIELLGIMMAALPIQDLTFLGRRPTPIDVFRNATFGECAKSLGLALTIDEAGSTTRTLLRPGAIFGERYISDTRAYEQLRGQMIGVLTAQSITLEAYEAGERAARR